MDKKRSNKGADDGAVNEEAIFNEAIKDRAINNRGMDTLIFRTTAPFLTALMVLFSVFVLLRGHNMPGGGFIGGLISASAFAILGIANGVSSARRALYFTPLTIAATGLLFSSVAGLLSMFFDVPFMTALWTFPHIFGAEVALSTPLLFDTGVYLVVTGGITSIALALEEKDDL